MVWNCYYYRYKTAIVGCINVSQLLVVNFNTTLNLTYSNNVVKMNEIFS